MKKEAFKEKVAMLPVATKAEIYNLLDEALGIIRDAEVVLFNNGFTWGDLPVFENENVDSALREFAEIFSVNKTKPGHD